MKLDRFRAPALAAGAVLLLSGVGSAFAASPAAAPVQPAANVQQGDQTTPDAPAAAESATEPTAPDTDTIQSGDQVQQGDQTTPDAPSTISAGVTTKTTAKALTSTTSETAAEGTEAAGTEADGPGGHQDAAGQNVDHQFNGEE